jgi:hypothetical protein
MDSDTLLVLLTGIAVGAVGGGAWERRSLLRLLFISDRETVLKLYRAEVNQVHKTINREIEISALNEDATVKITGVTGTGHRLDGHGTITGS